LAEEGVTSMKLCHISCYKVANGHHHLYTTFKIVKMSKNQCNFGQLLTMTTNISGTGIDVESWKQS